MSSSITNYLLPDYINSNERLCLYILQDLSYKYGQAFMGYANLAKKMRKSIATVKRVMARLQEFNFIIVNRQGRQNATIKLNDETLKFYHPTINPYEDNNNLPTNSVDNIVNEEKEVEQKKHVKVSSVTPTIVKIQGIYNNLYLSMFKKQPQEPEIMKSTYTMPKQEPDKPIEKHYLTENRKKFQEVMQMLKVKAHLATPKTFTAKQNLSPIEPQKPKVSINVPILKEKTREVSVFKDSTISLDDVLSDYFAIDE